MRQHWNSMTAPTAPTVSATRALAGSLLLALIAVALVVAAGGVAYALWSEGELQPVREAVDPAEANQLARDRARLRCDTCGVIEEIRTVEGVGGAPASYVFAVRLPDGSLRQTTDPLRGRWQPGDRMMLIGR
jgi:hypothetical protein